MDSQSLRVVSAARELLKSHGYFVDNLWHANDIHFLCDQLQYPRLPMEAAMEVFDIANAQFDGEYGICWPQLEKALKVYIESKDMPLPCRHDGPTAPLTGEKKETASALSQVCRRSPAMLPESANQARG